METTVTAVFISCCHELVELVSCTHGAAAVNCCCILDVSRHLLRRLKTTFKTSSTRTQ